MTDSTKSIRLQRSIVVYSALGILVVGVVVALVSILPLYSLLKDREERGLLFTLRTKAMAVEELLSRTTDITWQITSRTRAREKLVEYNRAEVTLDQLVDFSSPILTDALEKSEEVEGICRLDRRGRPVLQVGTPIPREYWPEIEEDAVKAIIQGPVTLDDEHYLLVSAPILDRQSVQVGADIVLFELTRLERLITNPDGLGYSFAVFDMRMRQK